MSTSKRTASLMGESGAPDREQARAATGVLFHLALVHALP
jgi:hypothetical protein